MSPKSEVFVFTVVAVVVGALAWLVTGDPLSPLWCAGGMLLTELAIHTAQRIKQRRRRP